MGSITSRAFLHSKELDRPVTPTVQELISELPDKSKQRLEAVMQRMGIALEDTAGATIYAVTQKDLIMASQSAKLDSPLTLMESGALLDTFPPSVRRDLADGGTVQAPRAKGQKYDDEVARVRRVGQQLLAMNLAAEEKARSTDEPGPRCRGVSKDWRGRWRARIYFRGKDRTLGYFSDKEEAAMACDWAALCVHGSTQAKTNFPVDDYLTHCQLPQMVVYVAELELAMQAWTAKRALDKCQLPLEEEALDTQVLLPEKERAPNLQNLHTKKRVSSRLQGCL